MERGLQFAHRSLAEHEVLQKVMQTEPDVLVPKLTVESTRILGVIAEFLVPYLDQHGLAEGVDPREASDFLARMILSYMNAPGSVGSRGRRPGGSVGAHRAAGRHRGWSRAQGAGSLTSR